jgi:predicted phage tail protein
VVLRNTTQAVTLNGYTLLGSVQVDQSTSLRGGPGAVVDASSGTNGCGFPYGGINSSLGTLVWGVGSFNTGAGQTHVSAGATAATTAFPLAGGLSLASQTVACLINPAAITTTLMCNSSM